MFIHNLERYVNLFPTIRLYILPQTYFLGIDIGFYTGVFNVKLIREFEAAILECIGSECRLEQLQTGGEKISPDVLNLANLAESIRRISMSIPVSSSAACSHLPAV